MDWLIIILIIALVVWEAVKKTLNHDAEPSNKSTGSEKGAEDDRPFSYRGEPNWKVTRDGMVDLNPYAKGGIHGIGEVPEDDESYILYTILADTDSRNVLFQKIKKIYSQKAEEFKENCKLVCHDCKKVILIEAYIIDYLLKVARIAFCPLCISSSFLISVSTECPVTDDTAGQLIEEFFREVREEVDSIVEEDEREFHEKKHLLTLENITGDEIPYINVSNPTDRRNFVMLMSLEVDEKPQGDWPYKYYHDWYRRLECKSCYEDLLCMIDYDSYLKTPHWNILRKECLRRFANGCAQCGASDSVLHVHHRSYDHRGEPDKEIADLEVLCAGCHELNH